MVINFNTSRTDDECPKEYLQIPIEYLSESAYVMWCKQQAMSK